MMEGLYNLSRSKRFWTAIVGLVFLVGQEFIPGLRDVDQSAIVTLVGVLIGGFTIQDAAAALASGRTKYDDE